MVPVEGEDDLVAWHHLRWYSGAEGEWKEANYLPTLAQPNVFTEVINYGRERGVNVVPYVNSFGHNTFFPRMRPELSAKDADGNPTGVGYCITSKETRAFVEKFYTSIIERYFPHGIEFFHVQMDEVWPDYPWPDDPQKVGEPWCQCETCRAHAKEKNLQDYVIWLVGMLVSKGVGKVVMWNDQISGEGKRRGIFRDGDDAGQMNDDTAVLEFFNLVDDAVHAGAALNGLKTLNISLF